MPQIDMRLALTNPYTLDTFDVIRRSQDVNSDTGELLLTSKTFPGVFGVVTPDLSLEDLERMTEEQRQGKALAITTSFALQAASEDAGQQNFQPDIIVWDENNYLVAHLEDYSKYAAGFVRVIATLMDSQATPEVTQSGS
jgi:hypothetical protein